MGILIDCITILVMLLCIFIGYKKGLIKVAMKFVAIIVSIIIALIFYKAAANFIINNTQIDENISNKKKKKIDDVDFNNLTDEEKKQNQILKFSEKYINEALENSKENVARYVSDNLSKTIIEGMSFIGLLILTRLVLLLLNLLTNVIAKLPIISQFNKSGGIAYGIIEGLFIVNLVFAILYLLNPVVLNGKIENNIQKSNLGKLIYENNIIVNNVIK